MVAKAQLGQIAISVLDLRHVNLFLWKDKFKYEDLRTAAQLFEKGDTFDLKSGYHHIDIYREHWGYLGFSWSFQEVRKYFVLPFGLLLWPLPVLCSLR